MMIIQVIIIGGENIDFRAKQTYVRTLAVCSNALAQQMVVIIIIIILFMSESKASPEEQHYLILNVYEKREESKFRTNF